MKFTDTAIRALARPARGQRLLFDESRGAPPGFGLRITSAGGVAFILRYTADGRERRMVIGQWPTWTTAAARSRAADLRRDIDAGGDPLGARQARLSEPTVAEAVADYAASRLSSLKSGSRVHRQLVRDAVPVLGRMKLSDVRRADIFHLVESRADKPRAAGLLLNHLKGLFGWAADREMIPSDPTAGVRPGRIHRDIRQVSRARVLDDAEVAALWSSAEGCGMHRLTALASKMILLTGQRPGEVCGMTWAEVDTAARTWTIPAARRGKTRDAHTVPLCQTALELLEAARDEVARLTPRRRTEATGCVFEARPGAPLTVGALNRAMTRYHDALGNRDLPELGHWTPHDLRRTCRTRLSEIGITPDIAELTVGHAKRGIVAVYDRHGYAPQIRVALEAWERRLLAIVHGDAGDNVVPLRRK